jgi:hypothetical protein
VLYIRCSAGFLATALVFGLGLACKGNEANESGGEAEPTPVAAAEDVPLAGHAFLRLTEVPAGLLLEKFGERPIEFAIDELENYYLGVGSRVLVVETPGSDKAIVRVIEMPEGLRLLGIHDRDLILFGKDPARCTDESERGKLFGGPSKACASVYRRPTEEGEVQLVGALDARNAVLVGDRVAALVDDGLATLALGSGEVRKVGFEGSGGELEVEGDRLLWDAIVGQERSVVYQSRAPFDKVEVAFQLDETLESQAISDVTWLGDGFVYLVGAPNSVTLHRRIGDRTDLLLTDVQGPTSLVHAAGTAWLMTGPLGKEQLWKIGPKEHRKVTFESTPKFVAGTRWGLLWIEEGEKTASFHLSGMGPNGLEAPALAAKIVTLPPKSDVGFGGAPAGEARPSAEPTVDGDLQVDIVKRIVRAHAKETRACWDAAAKTNPELAGVLTVAFTIAKTGKVGKAEVVGEPLDAALGKCVTKAIRSWTFPKPGDGEPVDVSYPFAFPPT